MSQSHHNAQMQANAARDAARQTARATRDATKAQIEYDRSVERDKKRKLAECIEAFANLDDSSLFRKSDKDLAHFQAEHPPESPQYALALNEWNRRLVARQVNATKFSAVIGVTGIIIGSFLGWFLASVDPPTSSKPEKQPAQEQPLKNHQGNVPDKVSPKPE